MKSYVVYWIKQDQIVILHKSTLYTEVDFDLGIKYVQAELGPSSDFETICELDTQWDHLSEIEISIKDFDNGATPESMAMKIVVTGLSPKLLGSKSSTVLDVGNFIYKEYGLQYEMGPEFSNVDEPKNSLTFFVNKAQFRRMTHLIRYISEVTGESEKLVELGAVRFNLKIKTAG